MFYCCVASTLSSFGRTKLVIRLNPKFMKLAINTYANPFSVKLTLYMYFLSLLFYSDPNKILSFAFCNSLVEKTFSVDCLKNIFAFMDLG